MVSKTPDEEPALDIMLTQTQALGSTANVFYSKRNEKFGVSLYGSGHYQKAYDPENDGFSNLPKTKSISFNPNLTLTDNKKVCRVTGRNVPVRVEHQCFVVARLCGLNASKNTVEF